MKALLVIEKISKLLVRWNNDLSDLDRARERDQRRPGVRSRRPSFIESQNRFMAF